MKPAMTGLTNQSWQVSNLVLSYKPPQSITISPPLAFEPYTAMFYSTIPFSPHPTLPNPSMGTPALPPLPSPPLPSLLATSPTPHHLTPQYNQPPAPTLRPSCPPHVISPLPPPPPHPPPLTSLLHSNLPIAPHPSIPTLPQALFQHAIFYYQPFQRRIPAQLHWPLFYQRPRHIQVMRLYRTFRIDSCAPHPTQQHRICP